MNKRVVVTGVGLVTPLGTGVEKTWSGLCKGKSGVAAITRFDTENFPVKIAAEVKDFNAEDFMDRKLAKHSDLFVQYAIAATDQALGDSGFTITEKNSARVGVITGCGLGGLPTIEKYHSVFLNRGPKKITPFFIPMVIPNMNAGVVSIHIRARGPNLTLTTACAAGTHAVGEAFRSIRRGECDAVVTGGSESVICPLAIGGFGAMKALSTRNDEPEKASRPFDKDRDGFIVAEGAGMLILEELEHALNRGAKIYAEMVGYGLSSDGYHITSPPEDGEGAARCMQAALDYAGIAPDNVDYINAHGTSTQANDICETRAVKTVFGDHAYKLNVSSTKSMTGHMLGGAGGIETVFTALAIHTETIPPTANLENPDPECDLDYVPDVARKTKIRVAMSNTFGFGGTNASLVLKRYNG
ncbi:MAG: beta-ketoacyl-ACP synthase II [Thermodesulfobacteriota bacterium]|nr:beta-ketoacyl-ACP synthase II [Thermodesulfobacteriota bacterium]